MSPTLITVYSNDEQKEARLGLYCSSGRPRDDILAPALPVRLAINPSSAALAALRSNLSSSQSLVAPQSLRPTTRRSPKPRRPMPQGRRTSKVPLFHVAHVVHGPSQVCNMSKLGRTLPVYRVDQASISYVLLFSFRSRYAALHSSISSFTLGF